jgi:Major Facilitator Superfamily
MRQVRRGLRLRQPETHSWSATGTWGSLTAGVALIVAFGWWQTRAVHPLLPLRVLLDRNRGTSFLAMLISSGAMFGLFLFLTYYLQESLGYMPVATGLAFLPMVGAVMVTLATGLLLPRLGPKVLVPLGMGLAVVGLVWLTRLGLASSYAGNVLPPLIVAGLGIGLVMASAMNVATSGIGADAAGAASAAVNAMQQVGVSCRDSTATHGQVPVALQPQLAGTHWPAPAFYL